MEILLLHWFRKYIDHFRYISIKTKQIKNISEWEVILLSLRLWYFKFQSTKIENWSCKNVLQKTTKKLYLLSVFRYIDIKYSTKYDLYRIVALDICCSKNNDNLLIYVGCFFFIIVLTTEKNHISSLISYYRRRMALSLF